MQKTMEISFDSTITAAQVRKNILRLRGVQECDATGPQTVTVNYDESRVQAKLIVKAAGCLPRMQRKARILSVRELSTTN